MSCSGCGSVSSGCTLCGFGSLSPQQARGSLAQRLAGVADNIRQNIATPFGVRPYRVFMVWTAWTGAARGEGGKQRILARVEILPTPRVNDLTAVTYRQWGIGVVPEGSVRVDRISSRVYTEDELRGLTRPCPSPGQPQPPPVVGVRGPDFPDEYGPNVNFFYEVVEDGRGDEPPDRKRFRLMGVPMRKPDSAEWIVLLQREDRDMNRDGQPSTEAEQAALLLPR